MRYSDHEQRQMDIKSGEELDRHAEHRAQRMVDDAKVYCRDAVRSIERADWEAATQILLTRVRKLDMALQSLTPGGSEYVGDPERCVARARENLETYRQLWREAVSKLTQPT